MQNFTEEQKILVEKLCEDNPEFVKTLGNLWALYTTEGGIIDGLIFKELEEYEKQYSEQFNDLLHIKKQIENMEHEFDDMFSNSPQETEPEAEIILEPEPIPEEIKTDNEKSQLDSLLNELDISHPIYPPAHKDRERKNRIPAVNLEQQTGMVLRSYSC